MFQARYRGQKFLLRKHISSSIFFSNNKVNELPFLWKMDHDKQDKLIKYVS